MLRTLGLLALVGGTTGLVVPPALAPRALGAAASPVHRIGTSPAMQKEDGVRAGLVTEVPFEVRFSIGNAISISGAVLLLYCLLSFLFSNGQADLLQTLGFVYAIPALVGGLALKYAELPPVPLSQVGATAKEMEALRESKATKIQKKILSDATRFTYGDAHMEEPLRALKLAPRGMGPPELKSLSESKTPSGGYALSMIFFAPNTPYRVWKDRMVCLETP
mmetsp:Transcript_24250/g.66870  ORF Transcript_24250/g.66870 Transcript_24250/m.66870 type:complete len:221 (-) Transcript_24250:712-1374(-)